MAGVAAHLALALVLIASSAFKLASPSSTQAALGTFGIESQVAAAVAKSRTFELAPQTIAVRPGEPTTVQLAVPKSARKLLKKGFEAGKKGAASVTATATDGLGATDLDRLAVKLKKKPKK